SFLLFFLPLPPPPTSTPFPYTTLFRSVGLLVVAVGFVAFMATPPIQRESFKKALSWLGWAPVVPVAVITAIVLLRAGGGTHALPQQFTPVAMTMLLAAKTAAWEPAVRDRKSTRLNSSHVSISYAVFCLKKKNIR